MYSWLIFKEATPGRRLKLLRKYRGFSQKEFGKALDFSEKSADIRVAQYENGSRNPKKDIWDKMAELLKVSPSTLSPSVCTSCDELLQSLFWLEYTKGSDAMTVIPNGAAVVALFFAFQASSSGQLNAI